MKPVLASLKRLYPLKVTKEQLKAAVPDIISESEYREITGETFEA